MPGLRLKNDTSWTIGVAWGGGQGAAVLAPGANAPMPYGGTWNPMQGGLVGICAPQAPNPDGSQAQGLLQLLVGPKGARVVHGGADASDAADAADVMVFAAPSSLAWPFDIPDGAAPSAAPVSWLIGHNTKVVTSPSAVTFQPATAAEGAAPATGDPVSDPATDPATNPATNPASDTQACSVVLSTSMVALIAGVAGAFVVLIFGCVCVWGWTKSASARAKKRRAAVGGNQ
jgi:hypothetical protein